MELPVKQMKFDDAHSSELEYASKLTVSVVDSLSYNELDSINFDDDLKMFFQTEHILKQNEYFSINPIDKPGINFN